MPSRRQGKGTRQAVVLGQKISDKVALCQRGGGFQTGLDVAQQLLYPRATLRLWSKLDEVEACDGAVVLNVAGGKGGIGFKGSGRDKRVHDPESMRKCVLL